ncbi:hypothetical protein HQ531_15400 [bacterium]|nr:hypothetical protein [bacterium]
MKYLTTTLFVFLLLTACELFTPRGSEPPIDASDPYAWKPPTSPEIVLENLSNAFPSYKLNYLLDVLANDPEAETQFSFEPDPGVASSQADVFASWGYAEEESFITQLFQLLNEDGLQRLEWQEEQLSPVDEDSYKIIADYQLTLSYLENRANLPTQIKGQATLTLVPNADNLFEILVWQDHDLQSDTLLCWSYLKAQVQ